MRKLLIAAAFAVASLFTSPALATAPTLVTNSGGQLTGIDNLLVSGTQYNVAFQQGTCTALFGGCDANSDFTFTTQTNASAATDAILAAIAGTAFDTNNSLIAGCGDVAQCAIFVPYSVSAGGLVSLEGAYNNNTSADGSLAGALYANAEAGNGAHLYALFSTTRLTAAVPEPATWAMMLIGFCGIGVASRRQRSIRAVGAR